MNPHVGNHIIPDEEDEEVEEEQEELVEEADEMQISSKGPTKAELRKAEQLRRKATKLDMESVADMGKVKER